MKVPNAIRKYLQMSPINAYQTNNFHQTNRSYLDLYSIFKCETNASVALLSCGYEMQCDIFRGFID